jgi:hypothetical protein
MPMKKSGLFRNKNAKATPYKDKGVTEVGKEAKTQSYKEYVQKMFGGGMTEPAMKKNKMMGGGMMRTANPGRGMATMASSAMRPSHTQCLQDHLTQDYQEVKKVEEIFNLPVNIFYNEKKRNPYTQNNYR